MSLKIIKGLIGAFFGIVVGILVAYPFIGPMSILLGALLGAHAGANFATEENNAETEGSEITSNYQSSFTDYLNRDTSGLSSFLRPHINPTGEMGYRNYLTGLNTLPNQNTEPDVLSRLENLGSYSEPYRPTEYRPTSGPARSRNRETNSQRKHSPLREKPGTNIRNEAYFGRHRS